MEALLLIDIQNDFLPGGALAVPQGGAVVAVANERMPHYKIVVATQDWHPAEHGSFASNHAGLAPFSQTMLGGLPQTLWPTHCVQNTGGACFAPGLHSQQITRIFPKGMKPEIDSYSGFFDNGHRHATGLAAWLRAHQVQELHVLGLATDYCVKFTVLDGLAEGFRLRVLSQGCRGVDLQPGDSQAALREMAAAGAVVE